jgi:hypothetical protein
MGCVMRCVLPLLALCALSSVPLRASDIFDMTLTGQLSGSGTFTTDGTCTVCMPGSGLLSLTVNIGPDSGTDAFDISDDHLGPVFYQRGANFLFYSGTNSETGDVLNMVAEPNNWALTGANGSTLGTGTFSITPVVVPEPSSLFLLMPIVAIGGLRWRHQRAPGKRTT